MFLITQPLIWFLDILVVLEIYSLALRKHPGIATLEPLGDDRRLSLWRWGFPPSRCRPT